MDNESSTRESASSSSGNGDSNPDGQPKQVMTAAEAAEYLRIALSTLRHWCGEDPPRVPFVRLSARVVRFRKQDLDRFLSRKVQGNGARRNGSGGTTSTEESPAS